MKRMVTYLYEYRNGVKGAGAGFLKLDSRGDDCRIQLCLQGRNAGEEHGRVYFVVKQEQAIGILLGEVKAWQGTIGGSWMVNRKSICGSPWSFSDVEGMAVLYPSGRYLASCWIEEPDEEFLRGNFEIWGECKQPEKPEQKEPAPGKDSENPEQLKQPEQTEQTGQSESSKQSEMTKQSEPEKSSTEEEDHLLPADEEQLTAAEISPPVYHKTERIDISDIRKFSKKNWHLCSNSFVIHGFFNYHYLVCIHREEAGESRQYLGVPGVYSKSERAMAMLFGFPEFIEQNLRYGKEKDREDGKQWQNSKAQNQQQTKDAQEGAFGYWCCQLES